METQKKYLSFGKKLAYGTGDFGSNFFYMMLSSFVMIYMTDYVGLNVGIVGTLIMASKFLDGVTDVVFGRLIDKTKSKMGKARPWMFYSAFPLALSLILIFAVPSGFGDVAKYCWFFIFYTCSNALFYTANNISYATMSALITRNDAERVSLGSFRYIFAVLASILVSSITIGAVGAMGGGVEGWRTVAIIYAVILLIFNSIASLSCKELPAEEEEQKAGGQQTVQTKEKDSFLGMLKVVLKNKYYLIMLAIYLFLYIGTGMATGVGVYYFTYVIGNPALLGVVSMSSFVMIVGLALNPAAVKKFGLYKVNVIAYAVSFVISLVGMVFAFSAYLPGIVAVAFVKAVTTAPLIGSLNALVAEAARNAYLKDHVHTEGMMFSCSSIGLKVGSGIGSALTGWLLELSGYVGNAAVQSDSAVFMIKFINGAVPCIVAAALTFCLWKMNVVEANKKLEGGMQE